MPPVGRPPRRRSGIRGLRRRTNVQPVGGRPRGLRHPRRPPGRPGASPPRRRRPRRGRSAGCGRPRPLTTVRPVPGGGIPKGSRSPWTTSPAPPRRRARRAGSALAPPGAAAAAGTRGRRRPPRPSPGRCGRPRGPPEDRPPTSSGPPRPRDGAQVLDDRGPGGVEPRRRGRRAAPRDTVGLLHERHGPPRRPARPPSRRPGPGRATPPPAPCPQHEPRRRPRDGVHVGPRRARTACRSRRVKRGGPGRGSRARGRRRRAPGRR